jgi:8-amino-7-oxononanoate synthase
MFHVKHETPPALAFLDGAIADARQHDLLRERPAAFEPRAACFCSNDYLALASEPAPPAASGAGASRLVSGDRPLHARLEAASAELVEQPASLVFTSGYAANVGVLSALAGPEDLIVSDALNHASIIDGARLSRAAIEVVPHLDVAAVETALRGRTGRRAFVVTESYFSMDADTPDLAALRTLCDAHQAVLVVDEAHALGVLGPEGRGLCAAAGVRADVLVGTYGKAFGAGGAFVAGCPALITWLWNRARSFVFSTGLSPAVAAAASQGLARARSEPERRKRVHAAASRLRAGLAKLGVAPAGAGHIVPWIVGQPAAAVRLASRLQELGVDVRAIRPPSVPEGSARLRLTVTAAHSPEAVDRALGAMATALASGLE